MAKIAVLTTTIGIPKNLPEIYKNQVDHGHDDVHYYVIGDNKTPNVKINRFLRNTIPKDNFSMVNMKDQKVWLKKTFGDKAEEYSNVFQENNYQRRIIGFLMATQEGAEKIIVVDDDNFPNPKDDFVGAHINTVGRDDEFPLITSNIRYIDLLGVLKYKDKAEKKCYVRGYPLFLRGQHQFQFGVMRTKIAVNIGLWERSPDISAISRLPYGDPIIEREERMYPLMVGPGDYTSMCMQNLCFDTKYLVTQYEFPMNVPMNGLTLGRYDDIWAGYICKKILDKQKAGMTFGPPQAIHNRNVHDYQKDFIQEFWGMYLNDMFYTTIKKLDLESADVWSNFTEVIHKMRMELMFIDPDVRKYFERCWKDAHDWALMIDSMGLR